jgi:hypothetical protein
MERSELAAVMRDSGTVVVQPEECPLNEAEWGRLSVLTEHPFLEYEFVKLGDTGDTHRLFVGRFIIDKDHPQKVNSHADDVVGIVGSPKMMAYFEALIGVPALAIRRCQVNRIRPGGYVGPHVDRDANPDYLAAVVFQLGDNFEGGDYVVHHPRGGMMRYRVPHHVMLVSQCDLLHEVAEVTRGERKTLVAFLAQYRGANRRASSDAASR